MHSKPESCCAYAQIVHTQYPYTETKLTTREVQRAVEDKCFPSQRDSVVSVTSVDAKGFDVHLARGEDMRGIINRSIRVGRHTLLFLPESDRPAVLDRVVLDRKWYERCLHQVRENVALYDRTDEIFDYLWSSSAWAQVFNNTRDNKKRHLLQVVAMLSTLSAVRQGHYLFNETSPVQVDLPNGGFDKLKTTIYTHESKILPPNTNLRTFQTQVRVENQDCIKVAEGLLKSGLKPVMLNMACQTSAGGGYRKGDGAQVGGVCVCMCVFRQW